MDCVISTSKYFDQLFSYSHILYKSAFRYTVILLYLNWNKFQHVLRDPPIMLKISPIMFNSIIGSFPMF